MKEPRMRFMTDRKPNNIYVHCVVAVNNILLHIPILEL